MSITREARISISVLFLPKFKSRAEARDLNFASWGPSGTPKISNRAEARFEILRAGVPLAPSLLLFCVFFVCLFKFIFVYVFVLCIFDVFFAISV